MFDVAGVEILDRRRDYGEERFVRVGELNGRLLAVVYTENDEEVIRLISFRRAGPFERRVFDSALRERLGPR
jgi:uncharacterized DUF497 family protein